MKNIAKNALLIALAAGGAMLSGYSSKADASPQILRCTNTTSGVSWDVKIDYQNGTVDGFPAVIANDNIKWNDNLRGGHYQLDRASGNMTVIFASSTGGFMLNHKCRFMQ
ncbi:MAG TPA: hypothetical protein VMT94_00315 [Burkholderiales bacterium]|nr:hypothetical protein [Burkholderiales bacterium]